MNPVFCETSPRIEDAGAFPCRFQFRFVIVLPQRGHRLFLLTQVVPQLLHWLSRPFTGFTGPQL